MEKNQQSSQCYYGTESILRDDTLNASNERMRFTCFKRNNLFYAWHYNDASPAPTPVAIKPHKPVTLTAKDIEALGEQEAANAKILAMMKEQGVGYTEAKVMCRRPTSIERTQALYDATQNGGLHDGDGVDRHSGLVPFSELRASSLEVFLAKAIILVRDARRRIGCPIAPAQDENNALCQELSSALSTMPCGYRLAPFACDLDRPVKAFRDGKWVDAGTFDDTLKEQVYPWFLAVQVTQPAPPAGRVPVGVKAPPSPVAPAAPFQTVLEQHQAAKIRGLEVHINALEASKADLEAKVAQLSEVNAELRSDEVKLEQAKSDLLNENRELVLTLMYVDDLLTGYVSTGSVCEVARNRIRMHRGFKSALKSMRWLVEHNVFPRGSIAHLEGVSHE